MKQFLILLTVILCVNFAKAQTSGTPAEDSVKAVINTMFAAMKNADAITLKNCFADSIVFQTIGRDKQGKLEVLNESVSGFLDIIRSQAPGNADERITFETVKVDGPLAIAWTPYNFYFKGQFSHCGVNSFQLVRFNGIWKIQYIIDTRRREGCKQ